MAPDMEARAYTAIGAMDALVSLVGSQVSGLSVPSEELLPLLTVVFEAVKKAVPDYRPRGGANDDDEE